MKKLGEAEISADLMNYQMVNNIETEIIIIAFKLHLKKMKM